MCWPAIYSGIVKACYISDGLDYGHYFMMSTNPATTIRRTTCMYRY